MEKLQLLEVEYKKYTQWGYNNLESLQKAVNEIFKGQVVLPHVYTDNYGDASHVYFTDCVFIVGSGIYKKV